MRSTALLGLVALIAALVSMSAPASAQGYRIYPWCANYNASQGSSNCYFATRRQCEEAVSGIGGICGVNSFYSAYGPYYPLGGAPDNGSGY